MEVLKNISYCIEEQIDGLVQERHNSSALAMELRFSCTNPSEWNAQVNWDVKDI